jgi:hypothetical protein
MRTQEEILNRIKERKSVDFLGFEVYEYILYLTFENAKPFLKDEVKKKDWEQEQKKGVEKIKAYMSFAFEKAYNQRGISSNRSIIHILAWLWLDDHPIYPKVAYMYQHEYTNYGLNILKYISKELGIKNQYNKID